MADQEMGYQMRGAWQRGAMRCLSFVMCLAAIGCGSGGDDDHQGSNGSPTADSGSSQDSGTSNDCSTHVSFGDGWLTEGGDGFLDVNGYVTWDGTCVADGADSYAELSDGTRIGFAGHEKCVLAFNWDGCAQAPVECGTRIISGAAWIHVENHPAQYDDVEGIVQWKPLTCINEPPNSYLYLSNGWKPYFTGLDSCGVSFRYESCSLTELHLPGTLGTRSGPTADGYIRARLDGDLKEATVNPQGRGASAGRVQIAAANSAGAPDVNYILQFPNEAGTHACVDGTDVTVGRVENGVPRVYVSNDDDPCTITVTSPAPNVGDRIEGTFSATVKTGNASLAITEGEFSIVRTVE